jgi:hypothetical protein
MNSDKLHFFCFTFKNEQHTSSIYTGFKSKNITLRNIESCKVAVDMVEDTMLIACIYLGHMTKDEFESD